MRRGRTYVNWSRSLYNVIDNWVTTQIRTTSTREISDLMDEVVAKHTRMITNKSYKTKACHYVADD
jgi:hypothetical protein